MLIALCASHIDSPSRLAALHRMLHSVSAQTQSIKLYLSVSSDDGVELQEVVERLRSTNEFKEWLHVVSRDRHLTQFEHYNLLSLDVDVRGSWLMFTDDDDVWHERRVENYARAIESSPDNVVACKGGRMHNDKVVNEIVEYFEYATKFEVLEMFMAFASLDMLRLRGCDLLFRNLMRCMPCTVFSADVPWLYKQYTPIERIEELDTYLGAADDGWRTFVSDVKAWNKCNAIQPQ